MIIRFFSFNVSLRVNSDRSVFLMFMHLSKMCLYLSFSASVSALYNFSFSGDGLREGASTNKVVNKDVLTHAITNTRTHK